MIIAEKRLTPPLRRKNVEPHVIDSEPHPLLLQDAGIPIDERVDELTRLSRMRRVSFNQIMAEELFDRGDFDTFDIMDPEGITPFAFSFTHFTLPTILLVLISGVAASL